MATYAIGDIQGCFHLLSRLLVEISFDAHRDRIWLVGDLVNRGPDNLSVLRWAKDHEAAVTAVLGNHDIHLIARHLGIDRERRRDTIHDVLSAPDRDELVVWLRNRPVLYREAPYVLVHAGLLPQWTLEDADSAAREVEHMIRSAAFEDLVLAMRRRDATVWRPGLSPRVRATAALQAFTVLRTIDALGRPDLSFTGPPDDAQPGFLPWFSVPSQRPRDSVVVFGHWAALGVRIERGVVALDSGAVWGNSLTAMRLEDRALFQVRAHLGGAQRPTRR